MKSAARFGVKPPSSWRRNTKAYEINTSTNNANNKILKINIGSHEDKNLGTLGRLMLPYF